MIKTDNWIQDSGLDISMIMQVHDELVFEVKKADVGKAKKQIELNMTSVAELEVPLQVDIGEGSNLDEAH